MPSKSLIRWDGSRRRLLNGFRRAARLSKRQSLRRAYAAAVAYQFQGFCRNLHDECVAVIVSTVSHPRAELLLRQRLLADRALDRGNAQPGGIGSDFDRFGLAFWPEVAAGVPAWPRDRDELTTLNVWRNAIVHDRYDPANLGGSARVSWGQIRIWRAACGRLAARFDSVMYAYLSANFRLPW